MKERKTVIVRQPIPCANPMITVEGDNGKFLLIHTNDREKVKKLVVGELVVLELFGQFSPNSSLTVKIWRIVDD